TPRATAAARKCCGRTSALAISSTCSPSPPPRERWRPGAHQSPRACRGPYPPRQETPMTPYWEDTDAGLQLHLGDMRDVLPALGPQADLLGAAPPYAETWLEWDRWPDGWPALAATVASSMWCFGSMRMFLDRAPEFADWKLSQDVVWEKPNGS